MRGEVILCNLAVILVIKDFEQPLLSFFIMNEIELLEKELDNLLEKTQEVRDKIRDLKLESLNLDLEGKYIKYHDEWGWTHYCLVYWVTRDTIRHGNFEYSYMIRGLGFRGEFVGYHDCTSFSWDYNYEFYVYDNDIDKFKKKIEGIEEITRDEFDSVVLEMLGKVSEYHKKYQE